MDRKKLESRLCDWAREFGFLLPDGSVPLPGFFSQLVSTPHRSHLWEVILNQVEPKDKVQRIRKQILVAKLKADELKGNQQDYLLSAENSGIGHKIELWKRKKMLEKKIGEKKKQVDELRADVYRKAQSVQTETCKIAEIEKQYSELKEKLLISNLLVEKHRGDIEECRKKLETIKAFGVVNQVEESDFVDQKLVERLKDLQSSMEEDLSKCGYTFDDERNVHPEIREIICNKMRAKKAWDMLVDCKKDNVDRHVKSSEQVQEDDRTCARNEEIQGRPSLASFEEQFMLDVAEHSLQAILNRKCEKEENLKLKETIEKIEKLMFNKSAVENSEVEFSFLCPNEQGDSLTGRNEKMLKFMKALSHFGLKKRLEFLKHELEKISKENHKNEHWVSERERFERDMLNSSEKLESLKEEARKLMSLQKASAQCVLKRHDELISLTKETYKDYSERKIFDELGSFMREVRKGTEGQLALLTEMPLDAFRRIQTAEGKEVYEHESLPHCLDNYGGELREFFSSTLLSPYERPESIVAKLEARKDFLSHVSEILAKDEKDMRNSQARLAEIVVSNPKEESLEKNHKETMRILSKILMRKDSFMAQKELVRKVLKYWLEQPYRLMIPDSVTVNSMTLRQFEEKYRTAVKEIKYSTEVNQSVAFM